MTEICYILFGSVFKHNGLNGNDDDVLTLALRVFEVFYICTG